MRNSACLLVAGLVFFTAEAHDLKLTLRDPMHKMGFRSKENGIQGSEAKRYGPDF